MSEYTTIARPYAKAAFEYAQKVDAIDLWSAAMQSFAQVADNPQAMEFVDNPASTIEQRANLFLSMVENLDPGKKKQNLENFIKVLAENSRLAVLPEIFHLFAQLKAEHEKKVNVLVRTFSPLSAQQKEQLQASLAKRLQKNIVIDEVTDESLLGGAIIQAGDFVIDGSVRGKLTKLAAGLAA